MRRLPAAYWLSGSALLFLLKTLDEIELRLEQAIVKLNGVSEFKVSFGLAVVGGPSGQAFAVGIAGRSEIDPVVRHHLGQLEIGLLEQRILPVEIVEDVDDLSGVIGPQIFTVRIWRRVTEEV